MKQKNRQKMKSHQRAQKNKCLSRSVLRWN